MGLGDAIKRLNQVESQYRTGIHAVPAQAMVERDMIILALNQIDLDLGFDCDGDGIVDVPDTVEIFDISARTSCCRIQPKDNSRTPVVVTPPMEPEPEPDVIQVTDLSLEAAVGQSMSDSQNPVPKPARGSTRTSVTADSAKAKKKRGIFGLFSGSKEET